jgi:hypothetical protein
VSMAAEQIGFLSKDLVFAAGCLVRIVNGEYLHSDQPVYLLPMAQLTI